MRFEQQPNGKKTGDDKRQGKSNEGLKTTETPIILMKNIYYDFIRPHIALNGKTLAEKVGVEDWVETNG
ncbi:MAG: hypothetical protein QXL27_04610 [Candidatus Bathyarchaeia archaeon]